MKQITSFLFVLLLTVTMSAQNVVTKWSYSNAGGNMPMTLPGGGTWSTAYPALAGGTARNFAVGTFDGNERVFILTRGFTKMGTSNPIYQTPIIEIYNATTGVYIGQLNVTGVNTEGVTLSVSDGDVTDDGKLLMSNLARKTEAFQVYKWENEVEAPQLVIDYRMPGIPRYGDKVFIEGDYSQGTAKVYVTNKAMGYSPVMCWSMIADTSNPGKFVFKQTPDATITVLGANTSSSITTIPGGGYYYKETGRFEQMKKYNAAGDSIGASNTAVIRDFSTTPRFVAFDGEDEIIAYFRYYHNGKTGVDPNLYPDAAPEEAEARVELLRLPGGNMSLAQSIAMTPSLGNKLNLNGWGDIHTKRVGDDVEIYVFSAYNGFGKYVVEDAFATAAPVVLENWTKTVAGENPPMAGTTEIQTHVRNIAAGMFNGKDRIFAPKPGAAATEVYIFDAGSGEYKGLLNSNGVAALGTYPLSDGDVTEDGKLLLTNLARNAETFQVYKWENETAAPELVINYTLAGTARYGDKVTITGNYTTGTAKVYATNKAAGVSPVMCWSMEETSAGSGVYQFNNTPTEILSVYGTGTQSSFCPTTDGRFYYKEVGMPISNYTATGDSIGETKSGVARFHGTAIRYICKDGNDDMIAYFRFRVTEEGAHINPAQEYVDILRVPGGVLNKAKVIASTPSLGEAQNLNGWGDIVVRQAGADLEVFYYSVNNGLAKQTIKDFLTLTAEPDHDNWSRTVAGGNAPEGVNQSRNIAAGIFDGNDRVFTIDPKLATVYSFNAGSGDYIGTLNTSTVGALGTFKLSDGDVTEDGKLLLTNLAKGTETFEVYKWENETSAPELVVSHALAGIGRYGDKVTITGNYTTGTAKIYATQKAAGLSPVLCWSMEETSASSGVYKFNNTPTSLFSVHGFGTQSSICPTIDGRFYYKETGMPISNYDAVGDTLGQTLGGVARFHGTAIRYIYKDGNDDIIAYFRYRVTEEGQHTDPDQEYVDILRVPGGVLSEAKVIASTPSLGSAQNTNGWADIVVRKVDANLEVFYYSVGNGLAKHTIENFLTLTSNKQIAHNSLKIINKQGYLFIEGAEISEVQVYNTLGQKIITSNQNNINVKGLSGVYIVSVKVDGKWIGTSKILL